MSIRFLLPGAQNFEITSEYCDTEHPPIVNEKGQSFIEFVLLLASILLVSLVFMKLVNSNIGPLWEAFANIILENPNTRLTL